MKHHRGFTLIELSIVILIMGLILGGLAMPLSVKRENARLRDAEAQLETVAEAIVGFALANGHLPCPALPSSSGRSAVTGGACDRQHGFVPSTTLGLPGSRNGDNLLLDPWASPLRYSVSRADVDGDGLWDFTAAGEMRDVGMAALQADLAVCRTAAGSTAASCADAASTLTSSAPFVLLSLGKDWASSPGADQQENLGTSAAGGPTGSSYAVANDAVFVSRGRSLQAGNEYDDALAWASPLTLYQRLVEGGQLP